MRLPKRAAGRPLVSHLPAGHLRITAIVGGVAVAVFALDATLVEMGTAVVRDRALELDVHAEVSRGWYSAMTTLSFIGGSGAIFAVATALVVILVLIRYHKAAMVVIGVPAAALALDATLKLVFARPRPHLWASAQRIHSFSFPSGHATGSAALAAALTWVAFRHGSRGVAIAVAVIGILFALGVGFSRIYLGVHWPSDVLAGYALALFVAAIVVLLVERLFPAL